MTELIHRISRTTTLSEARVDELLSAIQLGTQIGVVLTASDCRDLVLVLKRMSEERLM